MKLKNKRVGGYIKHKFLLCFDNAENLVSNKKDGVEFRKFLSQLYSFCPSLSIIVTSTKQLGGLPDNIHPDSQIIPRLKDKESVELFVENAGPITDDDIY